MGCKQPGAPWRRRRWARSLSEVEPSRRTERSRWVSLSNPSNEWGGEFPVCSTPPTAPASYRTKWPRLTMRATACHATLGLPCGPRLTMRRSVSFAGRCLPCSHLFAAHSSAYRIAPASPTTTPRCSTSSLNHKPSYRNKPATSP